MISWNDFQPERLLKELTTFGIGGAARYFIEIKHISHMQEVLAFCQTHQLPFFILGKGSNVLFDDQGFNGLVIANRIDFFESPSPGIFHVGAGYSFSLLGTQTARQGWTGLEFASGIPASVGGAVYMNAGANGYETCQTLLSVDFIDETGHLHVLPREHIHFKYRQSDFQQRPGAIVGATFQLLPDETARESQLKIIQYRKKTQPYGDKSAGCFFTNPACGSAGALIDQLGLKGTRVGGAEVSTLHANFIINTGTASCQDILHLAQLIKKAAKEKYDIDLESEVRYVPYHSHQQQPVPFLGETVTYE